MISPTMRIAVMMSSSIYERSFITGMRATEGRAIVSALTRPELSGAGWKMLGFLTWTGCCVFCTVVFVGLIMYLGAYVAIKRR